MKLKIMKAMRGMAAILVASVVLAGFAHGQKSNAPEFSSGKRSIVGTWKNQVSIVDCSTGTVLASFPGLLTYHSGGTVSETTGDSPFRSAGAGSWEFEGSRSFRGKFMFYTFDSSGAPTGSFKVAQSIRLSASGDVLTDTATYEIFDVAGDLVTSGCAQATATRF